MRIPLALFLLLLFSGTATMAQPAPKNQTVSSVIHASYSFYSQGKAYLEQKQYKQAKAAFDKAIDNVLESGFDLRKEPELAEFYNNIIEYISSHESVLNGYSAPVQDKPLQCELSMQDVLSIRGLKLGMTPDELKTHYPKFIIGKPDEFGYIGGTVTFLRLFDIDPNLARGLDSVTLKFLDNRLVQFAIVYDDSVKWGSIDEFTAKLSQSVPLPNAWNKKDEPPPPSTSPFSRITGSDMPEESSRTMSCNGFTVTANLFKHPSIQFEQKGWSLIVEARRNDKREAIKKQQMDAEKKKREEFKP